MKALALVDVAFTLLLLIAIAVAEPAAKDPAHSQTAGALVRTHDIPQPIQTAITNGSMGKKYEVSFYLSPFYLRGDFDGDHKIDIVVRLPSLACLPMKMTPFQGQNKGRSEHLVSTSPSRFAYVHVRLNVV